MVRMQDGGRMRETRLNDKPQRWLATELLLTFTHDKWRESGSKNR